MGSSASPEEFEELRSKLKKVIRRAKRGQEIAVVGSNNPKRIYKSVRGKRVTRERVGPLRN